MDKKIKLSNKPKSQILFEDSINAFANKVGIEEDTLFTNLNEFLDESTILNSYELFKKTTLFDTIMENSFTLSDYDKKQYMKKFLEETYLNILYSEIMESLEGTELTFQQEMIVENTKIVFNTLDLRELDELCESILYQDNIEEGAILDKISQVLSGQAIANLFWRMQGTFSSMLAMMLYRSSTRDTKEAEKSMGIIKATLLATTDLFGMKDPGNSYEYSRKVIFDFDRINSNKDIKNLFNKLLKTESSYKQAPILVDNIFNQCLSSHHTMFDNLELSEEDKKALKGKYDPKSRSTLANVARESMKEAYSGDSTKKNAVMSFRKCLSSSLADIYKYLMIGVFSNDDNRKKIAGILTNASFESNPDTLIRFMKQEESSDDMNKRASILVQLRITFDDMIDDLSKGRNSVDKEASKFFKEKLKEADREISDFLLKNKSKLRNNQGGDNKGDYDDNEDINNNFNPSQKKRSILGFN